MRYLVEENNKYNNIYKESISVIKEENEKWKEMI
jgi:hypothetical protein